MGRGLFGAFVTLVLVGLVALIGAAFVYNGPGPGAKSGDKTTVVLRKGADPAAKCVECRDELKDQPMVGLQIIKGAKKAEGTEVWEDGKILDPENGKFYTLRMTPIDGGKKLEVRGSIGPFGRTQTWQRVE